MYPSALGFFTPFNATVRNPIQTRIEFVHESTLGDAPGFTVAVRCLVGIAPDAMTPGHAAFAFCFVVRRSLHMWVTHPLAVACRNRCQLHRIVLFLMILVSLQNASRRLAFEF